jgi:hypothetical protein
MQFDLTQMQDFMPKIALSSSGSLDSGQTWKWQSVDRAKGYFLAAMGMQDDALVLWSSAESGDAGMGVMDYLPPSTVDKWIKEKVVLAPSVTSCAIPKGIFAAKNGQAARRHAADDRLRSGKQHRVSAEARRPEGRVESGMERARAQQVHGHRDARPGHGGDAAAANAGPLAAAAAAGIEDPQAVARHSRPLMRGTDADH